MAGGIENNANSVQLQLQLPTGTELGEKKLIEGEGKVSALTELYRTSLFCLSLLN